MTTGKVHNVALLIVIATATFVAGCGANVVASGPDASAIEPQEDLGDTIEEDELGEDEVADDIIAEREEGLDSGEALSSPRYMAAGDPNRDPNWDWTINSTYTLQTPRATYNNVRLPYFDGTSPAGSVLNVAGDRDIEKKDGWVLVLRDFGSSTNFPFIILYNKYRGILRLFYYYDNPANTFSKAVGKMYFQIPDAAHSAALFTLQDLDNAANSYTSAYSPTHQLNSVGKMGIGWCFLDFSVSGFDPTLWQKEDPTLVIEVTGVTTSTVTLSGNINLNQEVATASSPSTGGGYNSLAGAFAKAGSIYKNTTGGLTALHQQAVAASATSVIKPLEGPLNKILTTVTNVFSWVPMLGPIGNILGLVVGGGSTSPSQPAPLIFHGDLSLNGTITSQASIYFVSFRVPGAKHVDATNDALSNMLPLYDVPLGVFNLEAAPLHNLYRFRKYTHPTPNSTGPMNEYEVWSLMTAPILPAVNLKVFDVVSINAFVAAKSTGGGFYDERAWNTAAKWYTAYNNLGVAPSVNDYANVVVQATLRPKGAVAGLSDVTVIRRYRTAASIIDAPIYYERTWPEDFPLPSLTFVPKPTSLTALGNDPVSLQWVDNDDRETGYIVKRTIGTAVTTFAMPANTQSFTDGLLTNMSAETAVTNVRYSVYSTRIGGVQSAHSNEVTVTVRPPARL